MTNFRTELHIQNNPDKIEYSSKIMSVGSGFSDLFADHFKKYHFQVNSNPYGKIYNPISIFDAVDSALTGNPIDENLIVENNGTWNHLNFHPVWKSDSKKGLVKKLNTLVTDTHNSLMKTDFLILTLGTAYAFKHEDKKNYVANCHKEPLTEFNKTLLSTKQIIEGFRKIYGRLNHVKNIILVVSPVMHTGDSITLNAVSKSILRMACHEILSEFPYVKYFPAYEFLLSDLRDYRFYEKDQIHPNEEAIDYIFNKFVEAYVHDDSREIIKKVEDIIDTLNAQPYHPQNDKYQNKLKEVAKTLDELDGQIDLSEMKKEIEELIR